MTHQDLDQLWRVSSQLEPADPGQESYEQWQFEQGCHHKRRYMTRKEAKRGAKDTSLGIGEKVVPYSCQFCGLFHTGHPNEGVAHSQDRNSWDV